MKDVFDAVSARIKAPYVGYAVLAFIAWNWRALFMLMMTDGTPDQRLLVFDSHTNLWRLYIAPLATGVAVAASAEWVSFFFEWISRKPLHLTEVGRLKAAQDVMKEKKRLEAMEEVAAIARAQRDVEVNQIGDAGVKQQLKSEIERLRREKDKVSKVKITSFPSRLALDLLEAATTDGQIFQATDEFGIFIASGNFRTEKNADPRDYSRYENALRDLEAGGFVTQGKQGVFDVTEKGWQLLEFSNPPWWDFSAKS